MTATARVATMHIRDSEWADVQDGFTHAETMALIVATVSYSICPRGFTVDLGQLRNKLAAKVILAVTGRQG